MAIAAKAATATMTATTAIIWEASVMGSFYAIRAGPDPAVIAIALLERKANINNPKSRQATDNRLH